MWKFSGRIWHQNDPNNSSQLAQGDGSVFSRRRPWFVFFNPRNFSLPQTLVEVTDRGTRNFEYFQCNYIYVILGLAIYSLLTTPFLLIALAGALLAFYVIYLENVGNSVRIFGFDLTVAEQNFIVGVWSIPLLIYAGATSFIFWLIGISLVFIAVHASFFGAAVEPTPH